MLFTLICFLTGFQSLIWAHIQIGDPLFSGATLFTFSVETSTLFRPTICFISSGRVSQCRRKRGIEEKPHLVPIAGDQDSIIPSAVIGIEATLSPNVFPTNYVNADRIFSSLDDGYSYRRNILRRLGMNGRSNRITVGDCGMSTVNFSQFLSCLGFNVQETTILTATYTQTTTISTGYTTIGVVWGCTPAGFPYVYCNEGDDTTVPNYPINIEEDFTLPFISMGIDSVSIPTLTVSDEILSTYPPIPEITMNNDNNSNAASTTNESPTYPSNTETIEVPTEGSAVSTADSDEIQIRPPILTTVSGESSTISSETIDYSNSAATVNTDLEVAPTSPFIPVTSFSETVESEDTTEEGLT